MQFGDVEGPCCHGGVFEVMDDALAMRFEIDACPTLDVCRVNDTVVPCYTGHGVFFLVYEDTLQMDFLSCFGHETPATYGLDQTPVTVRRLALCENSDSPSCMAP